MQISLSALRNLPSVAGMHVHSGVQGQYREEQTTKMGSSPDTLVGPFPVSFPGVYRVVK